MKQVVIYVRVSSREQKEEGYSIPAQKKLLWEFARVNKFKIVKEFEDDETAKKSGRTGFGEMVDFLKTNPKIDTILVEKTDRLYRNFKDYVIIDDLGITVYLVKENEIIGKDASSHQKFIHGIKLLMAKNYIDNLSEEVKKGLNQKAESGIYPSSNAPLGYDLERRNNKCVPVVDDKCKDLPIKIFEYYATGLYTLNDVVEKVKADGLFILSNIPKRLRFKTLTKSTIHRILRNPFYYGNFKWKGKIYKGNHIPLVSKELWDKAQEVLDRFQNKKKISKYNTLDFVFKGLMSCGECGRNITATRKIKPSGKRYDYYYCTKFKTNCSQKPVEQKELDKQIIKHLDGLRMPREAIDYVREGLKSSLYMKRNTEDRTKENLEQEKKRLEGALDTLYEDRINEVIKLDFYNHKSKEYENQILDLEAQISKYTKAIFDYYKVGSDILELAEKASFLYKNANTEEKQELLNFLLSNSQLKDKNLLILYKKPFDKIHQRVSCSNWRRGWDSNPRNP